MNAITLDATQNEAVRILLGRIQQGAKELSLSGPAGSGKTTLIKALVEQLGQNKVVVVAPTNQAAKVLNAKGIRASTYHSLFFVPTTVVIKGKSKVEFQLYREWLQKNPTTSIKGKLTHADVVIVDEASMVSAYHIGWIKQLARTVVLVGDGNQLAPVEDRLNPAGYFNTRKHDVYLTKVHRHDGLLLDTVMRLRDGGLAPLSNEIERLFNSRATWGGKNLTNVLKGLDANGESWRVVTWRNATRFKINAFIRGLYDMPTFLPVEGERLMCMQPSMDGLLTGDEITFCDSTIPSQAWLELTAQQFVPIQSEQDKSAFFAQWKKEELENTLFPTVRYTLNGSDENNVFVSKLNLCEWVKRNASHRLAVVALLEGVDIEYMRRTNGVTDSPLKEIVVDYAYAVTCHKAQGSEFDHIFVVDERYLLKLVTDKEAIKSEADEPFTGDEAARRWIYTALTRARKTVTVIPFKEANAVTIATERKAS